MRTDHLEVLPKGWSQVQCAKCKMVFALPPLDDPSAIAANAILGKELDRHIRQTHPREDASQAAVRIVKEATEGK